LGLAGITTGDETDEEKGDADSLSEKSEMIDNVIEELKDFGEIEED